MDEDLKESVENYMFTYGNNDKEDMFIEYNNFCLKNKLCKENNTFRYQMLVKKNKQYHHFGS